MIIGDVGPDTIEEDIGPAAVVIGSETEIKAVAPLWGDEVRIEPAEARRARDRQVVEGVSPAAWIGC